MTPARRPPRRLQTDPLLSYDGRLYDCDFNQMLDLPLVPDHPRTIFVVDVASLAGRQITTARHCSGCTTGSGRQGAILGEPRA